jgi:hypothetical protein
LLVQEIEHRHFLEGSLEDCTISVNLILQQPNFSSHSESENKKNRNMRVNLQKIAFMHENIKVRENMRGNIGILILIVRFENMPRSAYVYINQEKYEIHSPGQPITCTAVISKDGAIRHYITFQYKNRRRREGISTGKRQLILP